MRMFYTALVATLALGAQVCLAQASAPVSPAAVPDRSAGAKPLALHLVCRGTGDHAVTHGGSALAFGRHHVTSVFGTSQEQDQFGDTMDIEIADQKAKVRVPRRFLPPLHGGDGGWFGVKDLSVDTDTITGMVLINYANHPKMRIDRRTGTVDLDGKVGAYAGACEPYDPTIATRAF